MSMSVCAITHWAWTERLARSISARAVIEAPCNKTTTMFAIGKLIAWGLCFLAVVAVSKSKAVRALYPSLLILNLLRHRGYLES